MKAFGTVALLACFALAGCVDSVEEAPEEDVPPASDGEQPLFEPPAFTLVAPDTSEGRLWMLAGEAGEEVQLTIMVGDDVLRDEAIAPGPWNLTAKLPDYGLQEAAVVAEGARGALSFDVTVNALAPVTVRVDFGPGSSQQNTDDDIWIDLVAYAAQSMYDDEGARHSEYTNTHDVMVAWMDATGNEVLFDYFEAQSGFAVSSINGVGNALDAGAGPHWCYQINGSDGAGISVDRVEPDDEFEWALCGL